MREIKSILAAAGTSVAITFAAMAATQAQTIENGNGVVCESPEQVVQFIALGTDTQSALAQINTQNKSRVCEFIDAAYLVGAVVAEATNDKGSWQVRKILIVGLIIGRVTSPVQPYQKYTAFIVSKASPI